MPLDKAVELWQGGRACEPMLALAEGPLRRWLARLISPERVLHPEREAARRGSGGGRRRRRHQRAPSGRLGRCRRGRGRRLLRRARLPELQHLR